MSFDDLKGKVCVITGGAGVLGSTMVRALAAAGLRVAIADINKEVAEQVAADIQAECGSTVIGVEANVLERDSLEKAKAEINEKLGPIDILINGAGGNSPQATTKIEQIEEKDLDHLDDTFYGLQMEGFDRVYALNFKGTLLPTMVFTTDMLKKRKGVVLNISSMNSYKPLTKIPAYSAAKASVNNFTEWLAVHLAKVGIRVNAIAPGFFLTDQNRALLTTPDGGLTPRSHKILNHTPMAKFGEPADLLGALLWLASDQAAGFVTGTVIPIDGGFSAYSGV